MLNVYKCVTVNTSMCHIQVGPEPFITEKQIKIAWLNCNTQMFVWV